MSTDLVLCSAGASVFLANGFCMSVVVWGVLWEFFCLGSGSYVIYSIFVGHGHRMPGFHLGFEIWSGSHR